MEKTKIKLSIFKRAFRKDIRIIRSAFVILLLVMVASLFSLTVSKYGESADYLESIYRHRDSIVSEAVFKVQPDRIELQTLHEQFNLIEELKESYLFIAHRYSTYNYSFSIFFAIFSVISGLLAFLLVKKGWDNTKNFYLKASFLVAFFCSSLFGILPQVFATKSNIKNNINKYNYYCGLQLDIFDLVKDNKGYLKSTSKDSLELFRKEILKISEGIKENQTLYFDIDLDKIPSEYKPLN